MTLHTFPQRRDDGTATVVAMFKGASPGSEVDDALEAWRETLAGVSMTEDLAGDPIVSETNHGFEIRFEIQPQSRYWRDWAVALISAVRQRLGDEVFVGFLDAVSGRTHRAAFDHLDVDAGDDAPSAPVPEASAGEGGGRLSENPVPERWRPALGEIVHRLVLGDYAGLVADGLVLHTNDPTDTSIGRWIEDYPAHLVELPAEAWDYAEHGPWVDAPGSWWVIVDLWTAEEGRSDLSMEATVWDDGTSIVAKVDSVHVM